MLIIGLGNPGKKHEKNRHNTGFIILEELRKLWNFPDFAMNKKFEAEITEGKFPYVIPSEAEGSNKKIILARLQTWMNNSGEAVKKIMDFYKLTPLDIIVIHDDLDINLGEFRIATDSSSAGHNGVESIIERIGTQEFKRIRVGIEGEEKRKERKIPGDSFVLQDFLEEELKVTKNIAKEIRQKI